MKEGYTCAYCTNRKPLPGFNTLADLYPNLLEEWDYSICPYCTNQKPIPGKNSLKALYPEIAEEFSAQNERDPDFIFPTYSHEVFWECKRCGMVWSSSVKSRVNGEIYCPYCNMRKPIPGITSFASIYPDMLIEWDFQANILLVDPDNILPTYSKPVWWKCTKCNRNYLMSVNDRLRFKTRYKTACSFCKGYRRQKHHKI